MIKVYKELKKLQLSCYKSMKTSYIVIGLVIAVVGIGGVFLLQSNNNSQTPSLGEEENIAPPMMEGSSQSSPMVVYTDEGYSPKELTIKKGDIVTFKNKSSTPMWTASVIHPIHEVYPGTSIQKCFNSQNGAMFDACVGTAIGENWKFQFNEVGEWGYHNHAGVNHTGKIIVE